MNRHIKEREYHESIREISRVGPPDDEYAALAAHDALTAAYDLNRYPTPRERKRRKRADNAAHTGGVFSSCGGDPPCRE